MCVSFIWGSFIWVLCVFCVGYGVWGGLWSLDLCGCVSCVCVVLWRGCVEQIYGVLILMSVSVCVCMYVCVVMSVSVSVSLGVSVYMNVYMSVYESVSNRRTDCSSSCRSVCVRVCVC